MKIPMLIPIVLFSCNKKESVTQTHSNMDTVTQQISVEHSNVKDTLNKPVEIIQQNGRQGMMREMEGNKIIRTADANMIPFNIGEEFTADDQEFILKIKNFERENISGAITPEKGEMNIRFNQIKLPSGETEGPFGREMIFKTKEKGEIWLIIGKNNMASGETKGKFSVSIR
ncbi:MAG: hypothetical protein ACXWB7_06755 [Kaistella sp.]